MISKLEKFFNRILNILILILFFANSVNAQWIKVDSSGIPKSYISDGKYIYAGFRGGPSHPAVIRSSDTGLTWENVSNGLSDGSMYFSVNSFCTTENNILAGTNNGIFISSNNGNNWVQTNYDFMHGEVITLFVVDSLIFAGSVDERFPQTTTPGLFISSDNGQSWVRSDSGISAIYGLYPSVYTLTRIGSIIFAGTNGGVFSSSNNGKTWIWDSLGLAAYSFAVINSTLFVGHHQAWFISRSSDLGISWTRCDSGLPEPGKLYSIRIAATVNNLIAGTSFDGVYFSSDMGDHWKPVNEGLDSLSGSIASICIINNYIFAGSIGLWRRSLSEITSIERLNPVHPKRFELRQNYPNPFNPSTVITYEISTISDVSLIVYDILGREIAMLVNGKQTSGEHSVKFDGRNLSSGVYFYRLSVSGYTTTKKMLLIR